MNCEEIVRCMVLLLMRLNERLPEDKRVPELAKTKTARTALCKQFHFRRGSFQDQKSDSDEMLIKSAMYVLPQQTDGLHTAPVSQISTSVLIVVALLCQRRETMDAAPREAHKLRQQILELTKTNVVDPEYPRWWDDDTAKFLRDLRATIECPLDAQDGEWPTEEIEQLLPTVAELYERTQMFA